LGFRDSDYAGYCHVGYDTLSFLQYADTDKLDYMSRLEDWTCCFEHHYIE